MTNIIVEETGGLVEKEEQPVIVKLLSHIVSYLFHPLFITAYVTAYLLYIHPYIFAGFNPSLKLFRLLTVVLSTVVIPGFAVFLMWRLKLIQSMHLNTTRERIIPYTAAMIFYFWPWLVFKQLPGALTVVR